MHVIITEISAIENYKDCLVDNYHYNQQQRKLYQLCQILIFTIRNLDYNYHL